MNDTQRFDLEGLTLQQLRYFNAVAEGETFADAAALIGISQSALSQGIARLENVTGSRLLERDGRRRRLTDAGELVATFARRVLGESETLASRLGAHGFGTVGRLRIGMIDAAALYHFTEPIAAFRADHPEVGLRITVAGSSELEQRLADFRDDLVITVGPNERGSAISLLTEDMHIYGVATDRADEAYALYPSGSRTRAAIDRGLSNLGIEPRVVAESGNPAVLRELARLTGSKTVLPSAVVAASGVLRTVQSNAASRDVVVTVRDPATTTPLAASFIDRLANSHA